MPRSEVDPNDPLDRPDQVDLERRTDSPLPDPRSTIRPGPAATNRSTATQQNALRPIWTRFHLLLSRRHRPPSTSGHARRAPINRVTISARDRRVDPRPCSRPRKNPPSPQWRSDSFSTSAEPTGSRPTRNRESKPQERYWSRNPFQNGQVIELTDFTLPPFHPPRVLRARHARAMRTVTLDPNVLIPPRDRSRRELDPAAGSAARPPRSRARRRERPSRRV